MWGRSRKSKQHGTIHWQRWCVSVKRLLHRRYYITCRVSLKCGCGYECDINYNNNTTHMRYTGTKPICALRSVHIVISKKHVTYTYRLAFSWVVFFSFCYHCSCVDRLTVLRTVVNRLLNEIYRVCFCSALLNQQFWIVVVAVDQCMLSDVSMCRCYNIAIHLNSFHSHPFSPQLLFVLYSLMVTRFFGMMSWKSSSSYNHSLLSH